MKNPGLKSSLWYSSTCIGFTNSTIFLSQRANIPIPCYSAWIRQQLKMMPTILIQTMCNEALCGGAAYWLSERSPRLVLGHKLEECCIPELLQRFPIVAVSNNVYNGVSPLILADFIQVYQTDCIQL